MRATWAGLILAGVLVTGGCGSPAGDSEPQAALACTAEPESNDARVAPEVRVARVIDGDTIEVDISDGGVRATERVRLLCIDTPERGEPGFAEATEHLRRLLDRRPVRIEADPEHDDRDFFGRLLRYVHVQLDGADGMWLNVNLHMVKAGHTGYETKWGASSLYDDLFREAQ